MEDKDKPETLSQAARSTSQTNRSTASLQAARARACQKELEVRMKQVRMEGTLIDLKHKKEAAAAMAEAIVYQEAAESLGAGVLCARPSLAPAEDPIERAKDFVERHFNVTPLQEQSLKEENYHNLMPYTNSHIDNATELLQSTPYHDLLPSHSNVGRQRASLNQAPERDRSVHNSWNNGPSEFKPLPQCLASPLSRPPLSREEAMSDKA